MSGRMDGLGYPHHPLCQERGVYAVEWRSLHAHLCPFQLSFGLQLLMFSLLAFVGVRQTLCLPVSKFVVWREDRGEGGSFVMEVEVWNPKT